MPVTARRTPLGLFAAAFALLLPILFSPSTYSAFWAPKNAVLPLVAAVGLPLVVVLARHVDDRRAVARAGGALVAVSALSTLLSRTPRMSVFGVYGFGTGLLFVAGCVAAWAIGASLDERGRDDVRVALIAAVLINAGVAVAQVLLDLRALDLGLHHDRALGLMVNPIHLGALMAGGVALFAGMAERRLPPALCGVGVCGVAMQLSGTRSALLATAVVVALSWRMLGTRRSGLLVAALAAGLVVGSLVVSAGGGVSASARLAEAGGGGVSGRVSYWALSRHAVLDRPLLGSGPGTYLQATSPHRNEAVARAWGPDSLYADAHNLVVEYAVTTGLVGLAALAAFLALALRRSRGPLRSFAVAIFVVQLFEPQMVATSVPALLALGAGGQLRPPSLRRPEIAAMAALLVAGAIATGALLLGDVRLDRARLDFERGDARAAARLLPWPEPLEIRGRIEAFDFRVGQDPAAGRRAIASYRRAVDRDPGDPTGWKELAAAEAAAGRLDDAAAHYRTALEVNPVSTGSMNALAAIAEVDGRVADARTWLRRSLAVDPDQPGVRRDLERLDS